MVEEHASAAAGPRLELGEHPVKVVGTVEQLNDDPLDAQVVTPDLLDELGVVLALDEDAARHRDAGALLRGSERAGGRALPDWRTLRCDELDGLAVDEEGVGKRERSDRAVEILKPEHALACIDDCPAELREAVLDNEAAREGHFLALHGAAARLHTGDRIVVVAVIKHAHEPRVCAASEPAIAPRRRCC